MQLLGILNLDKVGLRAESHGRSPFMTLPFTSLPSNLY